MQSSFELFRTTRRNLLNAIENLTLEQLNTVPKGFNNTIGWNFIHCIITQQLLCYKLSGFDIPFEDDIVENFKKGSKGNASISADLLGEMKSKAIHLVDATEQDYNNQKFKQYTVYPTSYNFVLNNIQDAITLVNAHEALHLGYIMAMKKLV
jgi:hypothetical protein